MSKSSRVAWAACTACMLELMVPVSACWAEVYKERSKREHLREEKINEDMRLERGIQIGTGEKTA